jgi:ribose 5-phosphate isomerase B
MTNKVIAFGCDHAGLALKLELIDATKNFDHYAIDMGTNSTASVDYPDFANKVVHALKTEQAALGVIICGTGMGMCIAANRHPGIRAAVCHTELEARLAREHNNANILCLGSRILGSDQAKSCLAAFLGAHFVGGRHTERVAKLG